MYKAACNPDIERGFRKTLEQCRKFAPESVKGEKLSCKLMGSVVKRVAPLMKKKKD